MEKDTIDRVGNQIFNRAELLLGSETMERLAATRVILFGVGGVGSWCAEGLVRSGIGHLTIVDGDVVCESNINRQLMATTATVGEVKVEALRRHLLEVNPDADIKAVHAVFSADTADSFDMEEYDYVIDAIDSLSNKMELIIKVTELQSRRLAEATQPLSHSVTFFSSMGAALKTDPSQVRVSEFWQVDGCHLAATLRRRMRRQKRFPARKFKCVWSPEVVRSVARSDDGANGSLVHITAIMGFTLASLILRDVAGVVR